MTNPANGSVEILHRSATIDDLHISYRQAGTGEPLVLLHGFPQHSYMWEAVMPQLAQHFLVIAPDQRGAGGSSKPAGGYDKRTMAADIYKLVHDQLGFNSVNLLGYDHGAGTAFAYAAAHPDQVKRAAFVEFVFPGFGYEEYIAPKPGWDQGWQLVAFTVPDICERFMAGRERELLSWYFQINAANPEAINQADFEMYVRTLQQPGALRAGFNYFAAIWDDSEHNREAVAKGKLKMPVLQLGGDRAVGAFGLDSVKGIAENVRGEVIQDAGHWLVEEQPAAFTKVVLDFFS